MSAIPESLIDRPVTQEALVRHWEELGRDPTSPDYYELNEFGEVIMSPRPTNRHQWIASEVASQLEAQFGPKAVMEVSLLTDRGIRVPDVVWMQRENWVRCRDQTPLREAPHICVEVMSPGNTREEILMKAHAYLRAGVSQVVVVDLDGKVEHCPAENRMGISLDIGLP